MEKRRRKEEEESSEGAPGWMVTYGDMMTLLLTFFVLLISFSSIQEVKFDKAMGSLKKALGVLPYKSGLQKKMKFFKELTKSELDEEMLDKVMKLQKSIDEEGLQEAVKITMTEKGIHIIIADPILFDLGSDHLKSEAVPALDVVAELLKETPASEVTVEGHTDNWPIQSDRFPTNWELSAARALAVVKYFAFKKGLDPTRFAATGYGEYRPIAPNDTPENRTLNRRVDIFIKTGREVDKRRTGLFSEIQK